MSKLEAISNWVDQGMNNKNELKLNLNQEINEGNKNKLHQNLKNFNCFVYFTEENEMKIEKNETEYFFNLKESQGENFNLFKEDYSPMKKLSNISPEIIKQKFCRGDEVETIQIPPEIQEEKTKPVNESLKLNELKKAKNSTRLIEKHFWNKTILITILINFVLCLLIVGMICWFESENVWQIFKAIKVVWCKSIIEKTIVSKTYTEQIVSYFLKWLKNFNV